VPNSVTSIVVSAFSGCTSLTNVTIPNSVTSIGDEAFSCCTGLTGVAISNSVTSIGHYAFWGCTSLTSAAIPNSVTSIGDYAFSHCSSLTNVAIPNSVTSIGHYAFSYCSSLTNVAIPNSVTSIGDGAFSWCISLSAITVDALNTAYSSQDCVLFNKTRDTLVQYPPGKSGSYAVPNSVTSIGSYAFDGCAGLTSVTVGDSVTSIGDYAFCGCSSLAGVYFRGNAPTSVAPSVFYYASNATVYYRAGTLGWASTFAGAPAVLWEPLIPVNDASFAVRANGFGFRITGTTNIPIMVEGCTDLAGGPWIWLQTASLTNGFFDFTDLGWTNHAARFYRVRSP
jgi:hypothetical protein